jgi:hypothetical protein
MDGLPSDLPARLPEGERVLWHGRPDWRSLARRAFHVRKLAAYFAGLLVWYGVTVAGSHIGGAAAALAVLRMTGIALVPLGLIFVYAWMTSRAALYTITNRRLVMRVGLALPITFNVPFSRIESAALHCWKDGHGSITLTLLPGERMAYMVLWPHARPWRLARTEPMLRCIPEAAGAAQILARALAAAADMPAPASAEIASAQAGARPHAPALASSAAA